MLITETYAALNAQLHASNADYGHAGHNQRVSVRMAADWGRKRILDYGCGKASLRKALGPAYEVDCYDPAIPEHAAVPAPAPVVVCLDVLEHVEPDCLDAVLADIRRCSDGLAIFTIHTGPAKKFLPDGRNTHLTQKKPDWWVKRLLAAGFVIIEAVSGEEHLAVQARRADA